MTAYDAVLGTPIGNLGIFLEGGCLHEIRFLPPSTPECGAAGQSAAEVLRQLERYFAAADWRFDLPLALGGTSYQRRVWDALLRIPAGATRTYGEMAEQVGGGARAVGNACRANPCPVVVPCHRVVGRHGPGGYGGEVLGRNIERKLWLLRHERRAAPP